MRDDEPYMTCDLIFVGMKNNNSYQLLLVCQGVFLGTEFPYVDD